MNKFYFPFGQPIKKVEQTDITPKEVFVLGVYASAVHAQWNGSDGKIKVRALAVASEPYIFWKGDNAENIIKGIEIHKELGTLVPAAANLNGPSGNTLDSQYLYPLGYSRKDAWLCDLLPYSRLNPNQAKAIEEIYNKEEEKFNLPKCNIPSLSKKDLDNSDRRVEILTELQKSEANTIILLGDLPIKHFLSFYSKYTKLSDFLTKSRKYGDNVEIKIEGRIYQVIPLVHPRQAGQLGFSSKVWSEYHNKWVTENLHKYPNRLNKVRQFVSKKPSVCPVCQSKSIAQYLYGMPAYSEKLKKELDEGKTILGGCCISDQDPSFACQKCKTDFYVLPRI
jgi:hypothetical protein